MNILIAGDLCPDFRIAKLIEESQFQQILGNVRSVIELADYSLVNLECPVVTTPTAKPIIKNGPNLRTTFKGVELIKYAGFKGVTLANNHFMDFGNHGAAETLKACDSAGLDRVGAGMNVIEAASILYKKIENKIVAFINCCEHEFSIATDTIPGCNALNPIQQFYAIREASTKADYVIVIVHGGHEFYQLHSPRMKELYRYFIDCGADTVINHHQHCYSGYEVYCSKPIFYGLGNFLFDDTDRHTTWNQGYMVQLSFLSTGITFELFPYNQCNEKPSISFLTDEERNIFDNEIDKLNKIIVDDVTLTYEHQKWMDATGRWFELCLTPYSNRYLRILSGHGFLPKLLPLQKRLQIINYIDCESHRDRILQVLKKGI